ncbi:MAG TPA: alpha/beta hydrolase-fold protein [Acidimicrobiia bacterium]|nr:alpha/beta hydrolase-fold protein [Acidimicrobiia bacterium]
MRFPMLAVVLLVGVAACTSSVDVPTEQHLQGNFVDESGREMRYLVWLPDGYGEDRDRRYPLIYFLHGSGDEDYDSTFVTAFGLPAMLVLGEQPENFEFVVISPQAEPGTTWYSEGQPEVVDALLEEMLDTYLVDPDRVYLTGLSMGGFGSWHIATRFPERYAAMASLSGSGYQSATAPPAEFACRLGDVPVWAIHGEQDSIADYDVVRSQVETWEELCHREVKFTTHPDLGHFSAYEVTYRDPELYDWFLAHSR